MVTLPIDKDIDEMTRKELMICLEYCGVEYESDNNKTTLYKMLGEHILANDSDNTVIVDDKPKLEGDLTVSAGFHSPMGWVDSDTPQKTLKYLLSKFPELSKYIG